ncbi:MAG: FlgD immunoglobulin-like domain containing protein [Candidatus Cloacimonas sp.]|nr:hypothetical protein [Candidatus Cloacimonadota bacterium]
MNNKKMRSLIVVLAMTLVLTNAFAAVTFQARSIQLNNKLLSLKSQESGFYATPNPFDDFTIITVQVSSAMEGSIVIKDLEGNVKRELFDGVFLPGTNNFVWDGTDERGVPLKPGKYIAELFNKQNYTSKTIILILK